MSEEMVSVWIEGLKNGDQDATEELWHRYYSRLVGLSRRVMRNSPKRMGDEEDVALSAFKSLCLRARDDRFPNLFDRDDLWKLLVTIAVRKAGRSRSRDKYDQKNDNEFIEQQLISGEPTPEFAMQMDDTMEHLMEMLGDDQLRQIATGKLDGLTNKELAQQLGRSISFVERKLQRIRQTWTSENSS